ncbi:MAG: heme A synthase [Chloroflexi bacterium]|nr:heme A synthase [Chloroflexota bacterium]
MTTDSITNNTPVTKQHRDLLLAAAIMTYLLIMMGGIVCVTNSGQGCPDWPGCYGKIVPPMRTDSIIEYTHRITTVLAGPLIIAAAIMSWRKTRSIRWVSWPLVVAVVFLFVVIVFGAVAVLRGLSPGGAAIDLSLALMVLALVLTATVLAFSRYTNPTLPDQLLLRSPFARLSLWTLIAVFVVLMSGVLVAESGSMVRCLGWPMYSGWVIPTDPRGWLQMVRRVVAGVASVLIIAVVVQAWRTQRNQAAILRAATVVGVLFLVETIVGAFMRMVGFAVPLLVMYVATATALWALLVVLVVLAGLTSFTPTKRVP